MLLGVDNKTWFIEMEVATCVLVGAVVAFNLMLGHALWMSLARK